MGYIREPKNVDLIVGPSVFTEATMQTIAQAIARYKKTGQKPVSVQITTQGSSNTAMPAGDTKTVTVRPQRASKKRAKI
ncbi:hypothetical protein [Mucilaginibacter sp. OK283]|jgi:hypothetical protein|uniref:hypothetical protein n=1 Tax=Mucilaginibacter sp. OK283 TaxID=1881049 RepID=UPI0008B6A68F|nr:hypothetical protein [Mucilaginibacter sp. OK283]SEO51508.1 hypothetical protein SAMN05428947_102639 [Mucilaginibacter sp. OK283]